nr:MAG TPA: hypothetical protein [Caudoviricetes sp.]
MLFIDDTGHGFELPSFDKLPVGYEYNDSGYKFWATGYNRNKEISVGHICSLTTYVAVSVSHLTDENNEYDTEFINNSLRIELSTNSNVFSLLKSKDVATLVDSSKQGLQGARRVTDADMVCTIIEGYLIIPIYVIGSSSEEGDWSSHILIHLEDTSEGHAILGTKEQYCPIVVSAEFVTDIEKYSINLGNNGVQVPYDVMRAVYTGSGDQFDTAKYNEKLKEYLINIHTIHSQVGNYTSALDSLAWFDWGSLLKVTKLLQTDNDIQRQFIREHFNINEHLLESYRYFRNSSLLSLSVDIDYVVGDSVLDHSNDNKFYGEGHPVYNSLLTKTVDVVHGTGETVTYIKNYFDFSFAELGIKLSMLRYYYKQLFLPIHLDVASTSLNQHVWANDIKMYNSASVQLIEPTVLTDTKIATVEFPRTGSLVISDQSHRIDDSFNVWNSKVSRDTMYIDEPCIFIPIRIKTINGRYKPEMFYNVHLILEKQIDVDLSYYDRYCYSTVKELQDVQDITLNGQSIFSDTRTHKVGVYVDSKVLYKDIPKSVTDFKSLFSTMPDNTKIVLKLSTNLDDVLEFSKGSTVYIKESKIVYKETSKKLLESSFSFVQRLDEHKNEEHIYKGLVIPVAWLNAEEEQFDIASRYTLRLLVNNSWYSYDFGAYLTEPEIHVGTLEYKYDERFKQVYFENGEPKFNAYMHHPQLVQWNNKQYIYDLHRYIKDAQLTSINRSKLNNGAFYYRFELGIDTDHKLDLNLSEQVYNKLINDNVYLKMDISKIDNSDLHVFIDNKLYYIQSETSDNDTYDIYDLDSTVGALSIVSDNTDTTNTAYFYYNKTDKDNKGFELYNVDNNSTNHLKVQTDTSRDYIVPVQVHKLSNTLDKYVQNTSVLSKKYLNRMHLFELYKKAPVKDDLLYIRRNFNVQFGNMLFSHNIEPEFNVDGTLKVGANKIFVRGLTKYRETTQDGITSTQTDIVVSDEWHNVDDTTGNNTAPDNIEYLYYTRAEGTPINEMSYTVYRTDEYNKLKDGSDVQKTFSTIQELDDYFNQPELTDVYYKVLNILDEYGKEIIVTNHNFYDTYNVLQGKSSIKYSINIQAYKTTKANDVLSDPNILSVDKVKFDKEGPYTEIDGKRIKVYIKRDYESPYSATQPAIHFYNLWDGTDPSFVQQDLESITTSALDGTDNRTIMNYLCYKIKLQKPEGETEVRYKLELGHNFIGTAPKLYVSYDGALYNSETTDTFTVKFNDVKEVTCLFYIELPNIEGTDKYYIEPHLYRMRAEKDAYVNIYYNDTLGETKEYIIVGNTKLYSASSERNLLYKDFFKETTFNIQGKPIVYIDDILNTYGALKDEAMQYDMYLMHDTNKYYVVLISRSTESVITSLKDLDFTKQEILVKSHDGLNKYKLVWQRSGDRFLINRMYIKDKDGNNEFSKDEVPVIYTTNYSNMWAASEYDHKWSVQNKSILTHNEEKTYKTEYLILGENLKRGYYRIRQNYNISYIRNNYNILSTTIKVN